MKRLIGRTLWVAIFGAFLMGGLWAAPLAAQDQDVGSRIIIMVPPLAPLNDANDNFGEDVAEDLRDMINDLDTHEAVSHRDINRARKDFDLDWDDLYDCVRARQLAMQKNWGMVVCGSYQEVGEDSVHVTASFVTSTDGNSFDVPPFTAYERDHEQAASQILETFDRWQTALRHEVFCQQYMDSQQWGEALRNCNQSLAINSRNTRVLYKKAFIEQQQENYEDALVTLDSLLEIDPIHQDGLKLAGIVATHAGQGQRARDYFDRYMELNPGDVAVRLTIARDISNAGDPAQALEFAQEGLEIEPDNLTLVTYIGHFAANAAAYAERAMNNPEEQGSVDPAQITHFYQVAAESYEKVFEANGSETEPQILERLIISLFKLQRFDEAVDLGARAVEVRPDNADIWEAYSRALQESGNMEQALAAIERTQELGKQSPALTQRKGQIQLRLNQDSAGVATLIAGAQAGLYRPTDAFRTIFAHAYGQEFNNGHLDEAFNLLELAGPITETRPDSLARNFWRGYIRFMQAKEIHAPATAASAREALPVFQQALAFFQAAQGYEEIHASADVPKFIDNTQQFIQIEQALIERGQ